MVNEIALPGHIVPKEKLPYFYSENINFIINEKRIATNIEELYNHFVKLFNNENGTVRFDPPLDIMQTENMAALRYIGYIYGTKKMVM